MKSVSLEYHLEEIFPNREDALTFEDLQSVKVDVFKAKLCYLG